jgi:probable phosphoglycerate mutase
LAGRFPGHALDEQGYREAGLVARALASRPVRSVISSPIERAQQTAAPIAAAADVQLVLESDLTEVDFGAWTGIRFADLYDVPEWRRFNSFRSTIAPPGGETMLDVQKRVLAVVLRLRAAWPDAELVLVSHGDIIKAALAHFLGTPLDLFRRIEIAPASRSIIALGDDWVRIDAVNLPPGS